MQKLNQKKCTIENVFVCMDVHTCHFSSIHSFLSFYVSPQFWLSSFFNPTTSPFYVDVVNGWSLIKKYTQRQEQKESHDMFKTTIFFWHEFAVNDMKSCFETSSKFRINIQRLSEKKIIRRNMQSYRINTNLLNEC